MLRIQETLLAMNLVCVNYSATVYQNLVFQALEQLICTKTWNWEAAHDAWVKITQEGFPLKWRIYIIGISEGVSIGSSSLMQGSGGTAPAAEEVVMFKCMLNLNYGILQVEASLLGVFMYNIWYKCS